MSKLKKSLLNFVGERFFEPARVNSVQAVSENFRLIKIEAPSFCSHEWRPGEKVQINVGDWNVRTYTPIGLDRSLSQIQLLVYLHGNGPGSEWARNLVKGDLCQVFGPRSSLKLTTEEKPRVLFGDETSIALAITLQKYYGDDWPLQFVFEVSSVEESRRVCEKFGILSKSKLVQKQDDPSDLSGAVTALSPNLLAYPKKDLFLTGNAKSIQAVRNHFREAKASGIDLMMKAYWAEGKAGLD